MKRSSHMLPHILKRVLPATLLVLVGMWVGLRIIASKTVMEEVNKRVVTKAIQGAETLSVRINHLLHTVRNLAGNDLVINSLIDMDDRDRYLTPFFRSLRIDGPSEVDIVLTDYRGRLLVSNRPDAPVFGGPWLERVMSGREYAQISRKGLRIGVPVYYSGLPEGALLIDYGPHALAQILTLSSPNALFAVFDRAGDRLFASTGTPWKAPPADGDAQVAGFISDSRTIPDFPELTLVCDEPETMALVDLRRLDLFFLLATLLNVSALVLGVLSSARMVTKPLSNFSGRMDRISGLGDLREKAPETGPEEFQQLARSFNRLIGDLNSATARVQENANRARAILNASPAGIALLDREGFVLDFNEVLLRQYGIRLKSFEGSRLWDHVPEELGRPGKRLAKQVFETGHFLRGENEQDGVWSEYRVEPVWGPDGRVQNVVLEFLDITQGKEAEKRARLADELRAMAAGRAEVSAMMLHHVGNALTPLSVYLDEIKAESRTSPVTYLEKAYAELNAHRDDLTAYLNHDERGRRVFDYMSVLIDELKRQYCRRRHKIEEMGISVSRITEILKTQRAFVDNETRDNPGTDEKSP